MLSFVEFLKRPELVVTVQEWFGVEYIDSVDESDASESDSCDHSPLNKQRRLDANTKFVDCDQTNTRSNRKLDTNASSAFSKDELDRGYRITNKFWYYLFVFGTELGDEIFYATMIPFWLWNIDGAVGRRVVFLWSMVMYIGQSLKGTFFGLRKCRGLFHVILIEGIFFKHNLIHP